MSDRSEPDIDTNDFLVAVGPVVTALGGQLVPPDEGTEADIEVRWRDRTVAYARGSELHGALDRLMQAVERELGVELSDMTREQKQIAVRLLDEQGAFLLRGAVEDIAQLMDVSRVTLYSYLNAIRP